MKILPCVPLLVLWCCFSCTQRNAMRLSVDLPIEKEMVVQVFNLSARAHVYRDVLHGPLSLDSLAQGIYLVSVMWPRDVVSPDEIRRFGPEMVEEQAYYSVQKNIFIDPEQGGAIRLHAPDGMTRAEIEACLLDKDRACALQLSAEGKNARLFEEYETILLRFEKVFYHKRDSLKQLLYAYNDQGDIENAQRTNQHIHDLWQDVVRPQCQGEERKFLMEHAGSVIVPFILYDRITDEESYGFFKPVIDALPQRHKNLDFIRNLETVLEKDEEASSGY